MSNEAETKLTVLNVRGLKVGLGPYLAEHDEIFKGYLQDPEVAIYGSGTFRGPLDITEALSYEEVKKRGLSFTIFELEKLSMIGSVMLRDLNYRDGVASLGVSIGRKEYWSKGYGTEAIKLTLDYGFRFLNLYNIALDTMEFNLRGQKAYQKAGFKEIGRRRGAVLMNGKRYDEIHMDCLASEFESPVPGWFSIE